MEAPTLFLGVCFSVCQTVANVWVAVVVVVALAIEDVVTVIAIADAVDLKLYKLFELCLSNDRKLVAA